MTWNDYRVLCDKYAGSGMDEFGVHRTFDVPYPSTLSAFDVIEYDDLNFYHHGVWSEVYRLWHLLPGGHHSMTGINSLFVYDPEDD